MPWLNPFKLGRPGYEYSFDFNPEAMSISDQQMASYSRNLAGGLKKRVINTMAPTIQISSNFLTKTQKDQLESLLAITDSFLSFQTRDDWQVVLEPNAAATLSTVVIQNTSVTKLSAALVAAGAASQITVTGVFTTPNGTGTNYFTGGSYDDANRIVTLGTPLAALQTVYVTYTYKGWLVEMRQLPYQAQGGWVDRMTYDIELMGV